jgi:outer membrane lipoprotein-sorting protein
VDFTAVINESSESTGVERLRRSKNGVTAIIEFGEPDRHVIHVNGKTAKIYHPKANSADVYDAAKFAKSMNQFALLGFGTTGAELKKEYVVTAGAVETIDGQRTTRLDLTPKSGELKKLITKVELWILEGSINPVREKVTSPSKDYKLVTYTDLKVNTDIPDSEFELNLPPGVKLIPVGGK